MAIKKKAPQAPPDLPTDDFILGGETYKACFDLGTLADAEAALLPLHPEANLLQIFPRASLSSVRILFAVATQRFHPEIPYEQRKQLLDADITASYRVSEKLSALWLASMPKPKQEGAETGPLDQDSSAGESAGG